MDTIYYIAHYIAEILQETWWVSVIVGIVFTLFMLAFDKESIECDNLGEYYDTGNHNFSPKEQQENEPTAAKSNTGKES